jgi:superfamily II DNA helicase RecQ
MARVHSTTAQTTSVRPSLQQYTAPSSMNGFVPAGSMMNGNLSTPAAPSRRTLPGTNTSNTRVIPTPSTSSKATSRSPEDENVEKCFMELRNIRQRLMVRFEVRQPASILTDTKLKKIAKELPVNEREFKLVTSIKEGLYEKYGKHFLSISQKYDRIKRGIK